MVLEEVRMIKDDLIHLSGIAHFFLIIYMDIGSERNIMKYKVMHE